MEKTLGRTATGCSVAARGLGVIISWLQCLEQESRSFLDTLDPSSAEASASNRQPLHLEHDVQGV